MNIFRIYKGWSLKSAIKDIMNSRIQMLRNNLYPDWFKKQFINLKKK